MGLNTLRGITITIVKVKNVADEKYEILAITATNQFSAVCQHF